MTTLQIFGLQFLLSLVVYGLIARWYVAPRLAALPLPSALSPLLFLHAFRHLGMVFLVPTVVCLFNIVGTIDLVNAFARGIRLNVSLGAAYYIPTFAVPALLVTHAMIFVMLVRRAR